MRGLRPVVAALAVALGVTLAAQGAAEDSAAAGRQTAVRFDMESPKCAPPTVAMGRACVEGATLTNWTVGAGRAEHNVPGQWRSSFEWTVPSSIPPAGGKLTMKLTATELIGGPNNRICPAMGAVGGFEMRPEVAQPVMVAFCAEAGGTKSQSKTLTLVGSSAAPDGSVAYLSVGLQDGPRFTYTYRASVAQATPPAKPKPGGGTTGKAACRRPQASGPPARIQGSAEYQTFMGLCDPPWRRRSGSAARPS